MANNPAIKKKKISTRFRNINILLFSLSIFIMVIVVVVLFAGIIDKISMEYAGQYGTSAAESLSLHIDKEIRLVANATRSGLIIDWMYDEFNQEKMDNAHTLLSDMLYQLYSSNLFIIFDETYNEYKVERTRQSGGFASYRTLDPDRAEDQWYFICVNSNMDYVLGLGVDELTHRKNVWIDHKMIYEGELLGVIATGLEFAHVTGEMFAKYDGNNIRGLVIDSNGLIHMDSALMDNQEFLHNAFHVNIKDEFTDPLALAAINGHLGNISGYFSEIGEPNVIKLYSGSYRYMTIAPIKETDWSVIILSGTPSLFNTSAFIPMGLVAVILLIAFTLATNVVNFRLIFLPLGKLDKSLSNIKQSGEISVYGIERNDELGELSKTIQDLFNKANIDGLTGIYNRRFMEMNLEHTMEMLARSGGILSVLMIDIDHFKKYNDTYGHEQGDTCLKKVAITLKDNITRKSDFAARYGGEEFLVVLPNTDEGGARVIAEKLLNKIGLLGIPHENNSAANFVTISIGATSGQVAYKQHWTDYVKRADDALYESKRNGRNKYTFLMHS